MKMRGVLLALALVLAGGAQVQAQWQTISPGPPTICSDGTPFRFFVYPGDPSKLLFEFEGGGGCWNDATCAMPVYTRNISIDPALAEQLGLLVGIYDRRNPDNPFRDWTHVYVPYCTGDLHWGNNTKVYQGAAGPYTVHHRGFLNASAAVDWAVQNVPAPRQLFVAGCSAGGYGSILWASHLMARYPGASAAHLSDSAAGVLPPGFFPVPFASWNVATAWPAFIPSLALERVDLSSFTLTDFYNGVASFYPLSAFSEFNRTGDGTQVFFYGLTAGRTVTAAEWSAQMQAAEAARRASPNFFAFTSAGTDHCVINRADFYTTSVGGVRLPDWVRSLADTRNPGSVP